MRKKLMALGFACLIGAMQSISQNSNKALFVQGSSDEAIQHLEGDQNGNYYVSGDFVGTVTLDTNMTSYSSVTSFGSTDIYIAKYDSTASLIWSGNIGGGSSDYVEDMFVDDTGNVYVLGDFRFTADLDLTVDSFKVTAHGFGDHDIFIAKYSSSGALKWVITFGDWRGDYAYDMTMDNNGDIVVTGEFADTVDFDPGPGTYNLYGRGYYNVFLAKYTNQGQLIWARAMGSNGFDEGTCVSVDKYNDIYLAAEFSDTIYMDSNNLAPHISSHPSRRDIVLAKYSSKGKYMWSNRIGNVFYEYAADIVTDDQSNMYVAGTFYGILDFNPDSPIDTLTATSDNIFIAKYDKYGDYVWAKSLSGWDSWTNELRKDKLGNLIVTGYHQGVIDVDPSSNVLYDTANYLNAFSGIYNQNGEYKNHVTINNQGNSSGWSAMKTMAGKLVVAGVFDSSMTVDSVTTVNSVGFFDGFATVYSIGCHSFHDTTTVDLCTGDSILIDGNYYGSGYVEDTLAVEGLCYRVLTYNLIQRNHSTKNLGFQICEGDSLMFGNGYIRETGTFYDTVSSTYGCDSVLIMNLVVNSVNSGISQNGNTLTALENNATYRWLDCSTNTIISGEVNQSFTATVNGEYAVLVTMNNCTDTSDCVIVSGLGISDNIGEERISVFPNPAKQKLNIKGLHKGDLYTIQIYSSEGRKMSEWLNYTSKKGLDISSYTPGIYVLLISGEGIEQKVKFNVK